MTSPTQSRSAHPARWLLALTLGAALAAAPLLASAPPAQAAGPYLAVDDTYSTTQSAPFTTTQSVLANDSLNGDALNWDAKVLPKHGKASVDIYPNFSYTPDPGFSGTDSFQYCLSVLAGASPCVSNIATVSIVVAAAIPVDDHFATSVGTPVILDPAVAVANDVNTAGVKNWTIASQPTNGTLSVASGTTYAYTPNPGFLA